MQITLIFLTWIWFHRQLKDASWKRKMFQFRIRTGLCTILETLQLRIPWISMKKNESTTITRKTLQNWPEKMARKRDGTETTVASEYQLRNHDENGFW